jgi:hypothetical protein
MSSDAESILVELRRVEAERARRGRDPGLGTAVERLKAFQQARFRGTYADLLESERFGAAAKFFLDDLYGPEDFSARDAQFARVVPALVRLFPHEVVQTVVALAQLHALTEELDSEMAERLRTSPFGGEEYVRAWRALGRRADRERQIELTLQVGVDLDRLTRKPLLRQTLHLMRGPARAAGLAGLQGFLEAGFEAFRSMRGAQPFLDLIDERERDFVDALFTSSDDVAAATACGAGLGQVP